MLLFLLKQINDSFSSHYLKIQVCTRTQSLPFHPYTGLHSDTEQIHTHLYQSHIWHLREKYHSLDLMLIKKSHKMTPSMIYAININQISNQNSVTVVILSAYDQQRTQIFRLFITAVIYLWTQVCKCRHNLLQPLHTSLYSDMDSRSTRGKPVETANERILYKYTLQGDEKKVFSTKLFFSSHICEIFCPFLPLKYLVLL